MREGQGGKPALLTECKTKVKQENMVNLNNFNYLDLRLSYPLEYEFE